MEQEHGLAFLPFLITEPVYLAIEPNLDHLYTDRPDEQMPAPPAHLQEVMPELVGIGDNRKSILILIDEDSDEYVSQAHQQLLHNILKAVALTMDDVRLVNIRKNDMAHPLFTKALETSTFTRLISFGATIPAWPVCQGSRYAVSTDSLSRKVLLADALSQLSEDPAKKKSLWMSLQNLFR